jgi:anti-sigma factor RsiW
MSEIHAAVGSYVINALDPAELDEFERHLASCPTCSREVVEFCETAAQLSLLAGDTGPPAALRSTILAQIHEVRPLPPELPVIADLTAAPRTLARLETPSTLPGPTLPGPTLPAPNLTGPNLTGTNLPGPNLTGPNLTGLNLSGPNLTGPPAVDELALRRQRRRTRLLTLAVAAVSVLALSLGIGVFNLAQNRQAQVSEAQLETQLFSAPDVKVSPAQTVNGGQVSFVSSKSLNKALFVSSNLPAPGERLKYQLWTLQGTNARPDALLDGGSRTQWFTGSVADATGLAVTIEPAAGSPQPTTKAQASAAI